MKTFKDTMDELGRDLSHIVKEGFFFLSDKSKPPSHYWVDLLELNRFLEDSDTFNKFRFVLLSILNYLYEKNEINSIIVPRWTNTSEDFFASTLYRLRLERPNKNFAFYEILKTGEEGFCICSTEDAATNGNGYKAIAIMGLDIHMYIIRELMKFMDNKGIVIDIPIVLSIMSRGMPNDMIDIKKSKDIYSLFDVLPPQDGEEVTIVPITSIKSESGKLLFGENFENLIRVEEIFSQIAAGHT